MGAPGSPQGCPKWGPHPTFTKTPFVWYQSICLDAYYSYETFFWILDPMGLPGSPQGRPKWGPHPTLTKMPFVWYQSIRTLIIYGIHVQNRPYGSYRSYGSYQNRSIWVLGVPNWVLRARMSLGTYSTSVLVCGKKDNFKFYLNKFG